jgi:hypothetical protein
MPEARNPFNCKGFKGGVKQIRKQILGQALSHGMPMTEKRGDESVVRRFCSRFGPLRWQQTAGWSAASISCEKQPVDPEQPLDSWLTG